MESSQNTDTSCQLPRGLITRRGTQRLPSLRSDSHSSPSLIGSNVTTTSLPITTKGGVLKRTFKPTIPVRRNASEDNSKQKSNNDNSSHNRRGKQPKSSHNSRAKDSKNWIQTEGAVFSGEHNPHLRSSRMNEESTTRKRSLNGNEFQIKSEVKTEENKHKIKFESKAKIIRKLYGNNFIDDEEQQDRHVLYPKGWHSVSNKRLPVRSTAEPLNPYNLLKTETQEKLLLMQIPEEFLKREDGYVGKMRVYKSGRIELHDSESNIKFDILFDQNLNLAQNVKLENDLKHSKQMPTNSYEDITEDVVTFNGTNLCALATIEHKQILCAVPQIPIDDHIGPNLLF